MWQVETMTVPELEDMRRKADDEIQAAYWRFCRMAQAKPPAVVCPDAYTRREAAEVELRRRRRAAT